MPSSEKKLYFPSDYMRRERPAHAFLLKNIERVASAIVWAGVLLIFTGVLKQIWHFLSPQAIMWGVAIWLLSGAWLTTK